MALENDLVNLINKISAVIKEINSALSKNNKHKISDIRYSLFFINELEHKFNSVNNELSKVNERISWAEPTRKLESLRKKLIVKYDKMYDLFDILVKKINT